MNLPKKLLQKNGKVWMTFEHHLLDCRTESAILLTGNRDGFLNLALSLLYCASENPNDVPIHDFPFVQTPTGIRLTLQNDPSETAGQGRIEAIAINTFNWKISEGNAAGLASLLFGLGFEEIGLNHLHIDEEMSPENTSVFAFYRDTMSKLVYVNGHSLYGDYLLSRIEIASSLSWREEVPATKSAICFICGNRLDPAGATKKYKAISENERMFLDEYCYDRFIVKNDFEEIRKIIDEQSKDD